VREMRHEVGCGEGDLAARLHAKGLIVRGSDFSADGGIFIT
jgi:2-polyprenyl-3-methyl-5-hydroxy-6-metoxy-1,4-benzoquinol methylase